MNGYKLPRTERETAITFNEAEDYARIETYNKRLKLRLEKLCKEHKDFKTLERDNTFGVYLVPKKYINISKPRRISQVQKEKAARHGKIALKKYWEKQKRQKTDNPQICATIDFEGGGLSN